MPKDNKAAGSRQAKDSPTRAPASGEKVAGGARHGAPTGGRKDDVRYAPESGEKTKDSPSK